MPDTDIVNYFDMYYHREIDHYRKYFSTYDGEEFVGEETNHYLCAEQAPRRIAETLPDVKLLFCFRNPMERAFSHWWHYKGSKHMELNFDFEDGFDIYDLYAIWIWPGFYHRHISRFRDYFPEENIELFFFDDLVDDNLEYVQDIYSYIGADDDYVPSLIDDPENTGDTRSVYTNRVYRLATDAYKTVAPEAAIRAAQPLDEKFKSLLSSRDQYAQGMDEESRRELEAMYVDDTRKLAEYADRDLDHWFEYEEL